MVMCKVNFANEVTVTPLTPVFGAEVEGVQLASATPEQLHAIKEAFWQHKVLVVLSLFWFHLSLPTLAVAAQCV